MGLVVFGLLNSADVGSSRGSPYRTTAVMPPNPILVIRARNFINIPFETSIQLQFPFSFLLESLFLRPEPYHLFPKIKGAFWVPEHEDCSIVGSILASPCLGKLQSVLVGPLSPLKMSCEYSIYGWLSKNYGPFLGTLNIRCRIIIGTQKGTIILTTTHMYMYSGSYRRGFQTGSREITDSPGLLNLP